uniref:Uncharacterized protein n=1 Tax=Ditylenchus dipsaci TaxID=166011 RepID=A0A915DMS7_9BILA
MAQCGTINPFETHHGKICCFDKTIKQFSERSPDFGKIDLVEEDELRKADWIDQAETFHSIFIEILCDIHTFDGSMATAELFSQLLPRIESKNFGIHSNQLDGRWGN